MQNVTDVPFGFYKKICIVITAERERLEIHNPIKKTNKLKTVIIISLVDNLQVFHF